MKTILIVDDEPMVLRVMRQALEKDGFVVRTAFDGSEAMDMIMDSPPDVLISDIDMPKSNGKDLVLNIEASMPERSFPIFITTSLTALEHRDWSRTVPKLVFVEKPISLRKLRAEIQQLLSEQAAADEPVE